MRWAPTLRLGQRPTSTTRLPIPGRRIYESLRGYSDGSNAVPTGGDTYVLTSADPAGGHLAWPMHARNPGHFRFRRLTSGAAGIDVTPSRMHRITAAA